MPSSCSGAAASSTARTAVAFWDETWLEKDLALTLSSTTNQLSRSTKAFSGARSRFPIQRHQGAGKGLAQQSEERSDLTPCLLICRETETETETKLNIFLPGNRCKLQEQGPAGVDMASDPGGSRYAKGERVHHRAPDVSGTFSVRVLNLPWDAMKEEVRSENASIAFENWPDLSTTCSTKRTDGRAPALSRSPTCRSTSPSKSSGRLRTSTCPRTPEAGPKVSPLSVFATCSPLRRPFR